MWQVSRCPRLLSFALIFIVSSAEQRLSHQEVLAKIQTQMQTSSRVDLTFKRLDEARVPGKLEPIRIFYDVEVGGQVGGRSAVMRLTLVLKLSLLLSGLFSLALLL